MTVGGAITHQAAILVNASTPDAIASTSSMPSSRRRADSTFLYSWSRGRRVTSAGVSSRISSRASTRGAGRVGTDLAGTDLAGMTWRALTWRALTWRALTWRAPN